MAIQFSTRVRNAQLDAIESTIGTTPTLEVRSGAPPANCAAADTGTVLATITLPSDWMAAASNGEKVFSGTWQDTSADAGGTVGHFRIKAGAACDMQGTAGSSGADLVISTTTMAAGQPFEVTLFTLTAGNA